ncbi:glutamyl-tRNA synthetase [Mycobacterium leprae Kyoto-2]|uniref:Glutamate--tRNA ligase n=3 Tax=Mycobacterium leprae TaxID=1769 RepID=SYE_MYCLE|nr:glutamate--tRNA ligase [Mycobacterium leprae]O33120.1 RecName: Full=Glutamate--tRNA ligase; AltName: Full=Glutamyl-tRNA synthetase; Short=GluRS [Mycobacterium leprae TN]CAR71783.1 glutamyl-tRNA synthase [Mycobacterium leprae Br4923]AWV48179.1 glutamate--tRNA ligase [Mycobacterium leprae]OAR20945.1 glutamate--tRNA ligase [Mycobacterium leprae 3125609]OAX71063.1 glutamate--tRNA ligase [Mycobacterium leprae 7935681]CAB16444.1 glutamyl-tRNA synthase [Mycobacterium leprae]
MTAVTSDGTPQAAKVRVRFCPSPTGVPHVGMVRTALFNWAYARHTGGTFVLRIEDTDADRDSEESYLALLDALRWLGLNWDEGPEVGGPYGPYRQSQRTDIYREVVAKLLATGEAYYAFSTPEEVENRHLAAGRNPKLGYDNFDRDLTDAQFSAYLAEGRKPVVRLRMPDEDISWDDLVRGTTTFAVGTVPDYVLTRASGDPLYTLVNPCDDALMKITHVLRGEDLLSSTPRQVALYQALIRIGMAERIPEFGHFPSVLGEGTKKLSKREPQSNLFAHRDRGFIPEGLLNYLALLGWAIADDHDLFSLDEMVAAFDVVDVNSNPARFDQKKADAVNAEHIRMLDSEDFAGRLRDYFTTHGYHIALDPANYEAGFVAAAQLVQTRIVVLGDAWDLLKFLNDDEYSIDSKAAAKELDADAGPVLDVACAVLDSLVDWTTASIEDVLKVALIEGLGLKPRKVFGPIRVAATGALVSPPLFESLELLGRARSLQRLSAARARVTSA